MVQILLRPETDFLLDSQRVGCCRLDKKYKTIEIGQIAAIFACCPNKLRIRSYITEGRVIVPIAAHRLRPRAVPSFRPPAAARPRNRGLLAAHVSALALLLFSLLTTTGWPSEAAAQPAPGWSPTKPVHIVVPFAAGGAAHTLAPALAAKLPSSFGPPRAGQTPPAAPPHP